MSYVKARDLFFISSLLCLIVLQYGNVWAASYEEGKTAYLTKDYKKAFAILQPLANAGDAQAQVTLGTMYDFGHGVPKNQQEAVNWYIKAAKQGIPVVQHDVGVRYFQGGQGVEQDYKKAAYWWKQSAKAGLADSQFNLGLMYYRGIGLEQDYQKARELFTDAAEQGHAKAQYSVAVLHSFGQGVEQNYDTALRWLRRAAAQNVGQAQFNLGVFYENGYGVNKDMQVAKEWYTIAAEHDVKQAKVKLAALGVDIPSKRRGSDKPDQPESIRQQPEVTKLGTKPLEELGTVVARTPNKNIPKRRPRITSQRLTGSADIKREDWVIKQQGYTLQLMSVRNEDSLIDFVRRNQLTDVAYVKAFIKGATRYNLIYGSFLTQGEAQRAISTLPARVSTNKPWIRKFGDLHKLIK